MRIQTDKPLVYYTAEKKSMIIDTQATVVNHLYDLIEREVNAADLFQARYLCLHRSWLLENASRMAAP